MMGKRGVRPPDEDGISINSTESDEYSSTAEFLVDRILAERPAVGGKEYLILWEGYPVEKSTWEPIGNIQHEGILEAWSKRQKLEEEGSERPFNLAAHNAKLVQLDKAKRKRQLLRKQERKRRGIPVSPATGNLLIDNSDSSKVDAVAVTPKSKPQRKRSKKATDQQLARSKAARKSDLDNSSSNSDLDNDLFVDNPKRAKHKALRANRDKRTSRSSSSAVSEDGGSSANLSDLSRVSKVSSPITLLLLKANYDRQ